MKLTSNYFFFNFSSNFLVKLIVNRCDLARMDGNDVSEWEDIDWQKTNETVVENNIICDLSESLTISGESASQPWF